MYIYFKFWFCILILVRLKTKMLPPSVPIEHVLERSVLSCVTEQSDRWLLSLRRNMFPLSSERNIDEDGRSRLFRNLGNHLPDYTASSRRLNLNPQRREILTLVSLWGLFVFTHFCVWVILRGFQRLDTLPLPVEVLSHPGSSLAGLRKPTNSYC
jgi:hypothetical protein